MIVIRRSNERGRADHGWLDTRHTFSFADYHDARFMGFSKLLVLNQDRVVPGEGFPTHSHRDMEIVSYVIEGALEHQDSTGTRSQIRPGDVQLMSAGRGVTHSEFNPSQSDRLHFLQMWVLPARRGTSPRYEQRAFPESERRGALRLVVAPDGREGALTIGQDARLYAGLVDGAERVRFELPEQRVAWLHVARGEVALDGERLDAGDGAAISDARTIELADGKGAEVALWDLPPVPRLTI